MHQDWGRAKNIGSGGSLSLIIMDDTAKHIAPPDRTHTRSTRQRDRALLAQALMRSSVIVEGHVVPEHALQVPLVQDEQVVQALGSG